MNEKSIFKKMTCPVCKKWRADETGKRKEICCGAVMIPSDKWHVRITRNGVTSVKAISSRKLEATEYLYAAKDAARRGQLLPGEEKRITWADAEKRLKKWIDGGSLADGTKENYHGQLKHLSKFFGTDLQDIDVRMVEDYRDSRMGLVAPKTVAEEIKLLKRLYALETKWNPARKAPELHAAAADLSRIEMPKYNNKRTRFLTEAEVKLMLDKCTWPHLKLAIQIALSTGLRYRNICYLEWKQIDFINRTITFQPEDMKSKRLHVSPLMEHLVTLLVTHRKTQALKQNSPSLKRISPSLKRISPSLKRISPFVFPSPSVPNQCMDNMRTSWENLLIECNKELKKKKQPLLDDVVFHTLRHTFASHFLMNGGDLATLSELLDHASIQITKDRYGHLSGEHKRKAIDQFSNVFFASQADR